MDSNQQQEEQQTETTRKFHCQKMKTTSTANHLLHIFANFPESSSFVIYEPTLYAMLVAIIVASIPYLKNLIFDSEQNSIVYNTFTKAITTLGVFPFP